MNSFALKERNDLEDEDSVVTLIVGDGLLGKVLLKAIPGSIGTSRMENSEHWFDLGFDPSLLPACSLAYLCAGTKGFKNCEGNHSVFRSDVDGNIRVAKHLLSTGAFVVFISSDCVEWSDSAYARNRRLVEMALVMSANVAIIRPTAFNEKNVEDLANFCVGVGTKKQEGVSYWGQR